LTYTRGSTVPIDIHFLTESALDDERLADYRDLQDRRLGEDSGRFVAESELVVRKLLATDLRVCSLLLTAPRLASLEPLLATCKGDFPVFVVPQGLMDHIAGFHVHRGCLAIAERPPRPTIPANARTVVVLVDLVDVDNLGAMARNAAAFGADAMLLSPRCADPFYRKAVRTSAGAVLSLPIVRATRWPEDLLSLREDNGLALVGAVVDARAVALADFLPPARLAILFGSEGPGLDAATRRACDTLVTIPMAQSPAVDSLNVATAGAVFLYHITQGPPRATRTICMGD
jgi:tRNA G18 (ribose-2'-O)-methylase SpoU